MSHTEETRIASAFNSSKFDLEPGFVDTSAVPPISCTWAVAAAVATGVATAFAGAAAIVTYQNHRNGGFVTELPLTTAPAGENSAQSLLDARLALAA